MRYDINLATRIYLDHRMLNRCAYGIIVILTVISVWNVTQVSSNWGEQSRLNAELTAAQNRAGVKPSGITEADANQQKSRIRFYNALIDRKCTNWLSVLEQFESTTPDGISLSSLSQEKTSGVWKLDGRAKSFVVVQNYLEKLESSKKFSNIMLLSHQNSGSGDKSLGVQFSISCKVLN